MSPSEFAAITRNAIRAQGFDQFLPVACFPARRDIRTPAGAPDDIDLEAVATKWASGLAQVGEEYFVAFKCSPAEFKVIWFFEGQSEQQVFLATQAEPVAQHGRPVCGTSAPQRAAG